MKRLKKVGYIILGVIVLGLLIPQNMQMPVQGATSSDYNKNSYWAYPWGRSITHKGVDIFAKKGTKIIPATSGLVLYSGNINVGGNIIVILSSKWRLNYYAHLESLDIETLNWASKNEVIGTVGDSGNAKGKPPHLHYSIMTPIPHLWKIDDSPQGWRKMFYVNPIPLIE